MACLTLVVLCFLVGTIGAEDVKTSLVVIAAFVGVFAMLYMGSRCWCLIFILPPLCELLPTYLFRGVSPMGMIGAGVFVYWISLWLLGNVKMRWRAMPIMDFLVLILMIYMVATYIRRPVAILALGLDYDLIGGSEYIYSIFSALLYVALSSMCVPSESLIKVIRWTPILFIAAQAAQACMVLIGLKGENYAQFAGAGDSIMTGRYITLMYVGVFGIRYIYSFFSLKKILFSPLLCVGMGGFLICIMLSGFRSKMLLLSMEILGMAYLKKELTVIMATALCAYMGVLLLSATGGIQGLPFGVQRCLWILPGVSISKNAAESAEGTVDWRQELWSLALDPRTGYIKDYVWGDGIGTSIKVANRDSVSWKRGVIKNGSIDFNARSGSWHSGWLTIVNRIGYVGLSMVAAIYLYGCIMMFHAGRSLYGTGLFAPFLFYVAPITMECLDFFSFQGSVRYFFGKPMEVIIMLKLMYCIAREQGWLKPVFEKKKYIPQMIQEHGERIKSPFAHV